MHGASGLPELRLVEPRSPLEQAGDAEAARDAAAGRLALLRVLGRVPGTAPCCDTPGGSRRILREVRSCCEGRAGCSD